jgi:hypothetical protein
MVLLKEEGRSVLYDEGKVTELIIPCPVTDSADQQERIDKKPQKRHRNS